MLPIRTIHVLPTYSTTLHVRNAHGHYPVTLAIQNEQAEVVRLLATLKETVNLTPADFKKALINPLSCLTDRITKREMGKIILDAYIAHTQQYIDKNPKRSHSTSFHMFGYHIFSYHKQGKLEVAKQIQNTIKGSKQQLTHFNQTYRNRPELHNGSLGSQP